MNINLKNLTSIIVQELLAVYQKSIVPIADVLLPNQFEAEKLSGMPIKSEADGWQVNRELYPVDDLKLRKGGPPHFFHTLQQIDQYYNMGGSCRYFLSSKIET